MRAREYLAAAADGNWVKIDYVEAGFGVGYYVALQDSASLTFKTQHGWEDLAPVQLANLTRSTTTATAVWKVDTSTPSNATHGLAVGDSVDMSGYGAPFDGTFKVATVADGTHFTYTVANSGPTSGINTGTCLRVWVADDPVVTGKTSSTEGNLAFPPNRLRAVITSYSSGSLNLLVNQGIST